MNWIAIISVLCVFIGAPMIVFGFIYFSRKGKREVEMLKYRRDIMALELEKEEVRLKLIEAENRKYDRLIDDSGRR